MGEVFTHPDALQRVTEQVDREACELDRRFFETHPERSYWIRRALPIEIAAYELARGEPYPTHAGRLVCIAVKQLAPGLRVRLLCTAPKGVGAPPAGLPERQCRKIFEAVARLHGGLPQQVIADLKHALTK
jgi:hypothetical protein